MELESVCEEYSGMMSYCVKIRVVYDLSRRINFSEMRQFKCNSKMINFRKFAFEVESFLDIKIKKAPRLFVELTLLYWEQNRLFFKNGFLLSGVSL